MTIRKLLFAFALLIAGGTSYADIVGGRVFCAPALDASGKESMQCTNAPEGGGSDPGTGGWQTPEPGWNGSNGIGVTTATYGSNCGGHFGNATYDLGVACDGASSCSYTVDFRVLGDPAPGCAKTFTASYLCAGSTVHHSVYLRAEAGFGSVATLTCQ